MIHTLPSPLSLWLHIEHIWTCLKNASSYVYTQNIRFSWQLFDRMRTSIDYISQKKYFKYKGRNDYDLLVQAVMKYEHNIQYCSTEDK